MERADVNGITLEYESLGMGEPVVFIHGAFIADAFRPLVSEPTLAGRYRLITYRRRGYGASSHTAGPITVERQAADCQALLRSLGVEHAHLVGHSFGGCVALQLALDAPELVNSLALLEPALFVGASAPSYRESLMRGAERYREEGALAVMEEFLRARWPGYSRGALEQVLPGAFEQAVADARSTFELDIGHVDWSFDEKEARRIMQPTLLVLGGDSQALHPRFEETYRLLLDWLPRAEGFVLPGTTHFLHLEHPSALMNLATALANFFSRRTIKAVGEAGARSGAVAARLSPSHPSASRRIAP